MELRSQQIEKPPNPTAFSSNEENDLGCCECFAFPAAAKEAEHTHSAREGRECGRERRPGGNVLVHLEIQCLIQGASASVHAFCHCWATCM